MDNRKIKRSLDKAQVTLELCLAFIIIVLFFVGVVKIWLNLNEQFVKEAKDYQASRQDAGRGRNRPIGLGSTTSMGVPVDSPFLDKIMKIQACEALDNNSKQQLVNSYQQQYKLEEETKAQNQEVSTEQSALNELEDAKDKLPWWCGTSKKCSSARHKLENAIKDLEKEIGESQKKLNNYNNQKQSVDNNVKTLEEAAKAAGCL